VWSFEGTKSLVITTQSVVGGRNTAMGNGYIAIGSLNLVTALLFVLLETFKWWCVQHWPLEVTL
jgi:hypothetical protein